MLSEHGVASKYPVHSRAVYGVSILGQILNILLTSERDYRFHCKLGGGSRSTDAAVTVLQPILHSSISQLNPASPAYTPSHTSPPASTERTQDPSQQELFKRSPSYYKQHVALSVYGHIVVDKIDKLYWHRSDLSEIDRWILYYFLPFHINSETGEPRLGKPDILTITAKQHPEWVQAATTKCNRINKYESPAP